MKRHFLAGKTLIELLVVVTLLSFVMGLASVTLAAAFRAERRISDEREQAPSLTRLDSRWRSDAHQSVRCAADNGCVFHLAGGDEIRYTLEPAEITREVWHAGAKQHRDAFRLPAGTIAAVKTLDQSGGQLARLTVRQTGAVRPGAMPRSVVIEAALNLPEPHSGKERTP